MASGEKQRYRVQPVNADPNEPDHWVEIEAASPARAAEAYCEWRDRDCLEFPPEQEVRVRSAGRDIDVYVVGQRPEPVYTAKRKKTTPPATDPEV